MKKTFYHIFSTLLFSVCLLSCSSSDPIFIEDGEVEETQTEPIPYKALKFTVEQRSNINKLNELSLKLLSEVSSQQEENVIINPLSISTLISMISNGCSEEALNEILTALDVSDINSLNDIASYLTTTLPLQDNQVKMSMANSLWLNDEFPINQLFTGIIKDTYKADFFQLSLNTEESRKKINDWVSKHTEGLIPEFLKLPLQSNLTLINTSYFKGKWTIPFAEEDTYKDNFYMNNGVSSTIDFLHSDYLERKFGMNALYTTVSLPFGNTAFSLQVILPNDNVELQEIINNLNTTSTNWGYADVKMTIPKFTIRYRIEDLSNALKNIGIRSIFNSTTALNNISTSPLKIDGILHETVFTVDESGAEAAAASGEHIYSSLPPMGSLPKEVDFNVNKPFIFLVKEQSSGAIIFAGSIVKF